MSNHPLVKSFEAIGCLMYLGIFCVLAFIALFIGGIFFAAENAPTKEQLSKSKYYDIPFVLHGVVQSIDGNTINVYCPKGTYNYRDRDVWVVCIQNYGPFTVNNSYGQFGPKEYRISVGQQIQVHWDNHRKGDFWWNDEAKTSLTFRNAYIDFSDYPLN